MARGGYVGLDVAMNRIFPTTTSRREAAQLISDALISQVLVARGCKVVRKNKARPQGILVDLTSHDPCHVVTYDDHTDIPPSFWSAVEDLSSWDGTWDIFTDDTKDEIIQYAKVTVREKELNALIKLRQPPAASEEKQTRERRRQPSWDQWVAAVACLAHEHQISSTMKQADFLDRVTARLQRWGFDGMPASTVAPAARAILDRYRSNPPVTPLIS